MPPENPYHSDDAHMHNATPVQSFVDAAHEPTDEERGRPRYGRPQRKLVSPPCEVPPAPDAE